MEVEIDVKGFIPTLNSPRQERELHVILFLIAAELRASRKEMEFSEALREIIETWSAFLKGVAEGRREDPELEAAAVSDGEEMN